MVANASQFGGSGGALDQDGINSNLLVSNTDPALAIRPQGSRRLNVGRAVLNKTVPVDSIAIAMAKEEHKPYARPMLAEKAGGKAAASGMSADYSKVASLKSADEGFSDQEKSLDVQANNVKKTSRSEEIAANRRKQVAIPYLAEVTEAQLCHSRIKIISVSLKVKSVCKPWMTPQKSTTIALPVLSAAKK
ncbi:MAG: hypothetical protein IPP57_02295 [Candidatus Obscuribacter sp.]|nr:hypothetical protein [Candidatus Obscuribacter sp.]